MRTQMNTADNQLSQAFTFNASNQQVRTVVIDNEPYFVAKDVCVILGISNHNDAVGRLDDDEKRGSALPTPSGTQQMVVVNESGLYHLIFQSRKPEAKAFRKWVTAEVLPTLRRTGRYEVAQPQPKRQSVRYAKRGEGITVEVLNLLWLIGESLHQGDQKEIALQLGVDRRSVYRVLKGEQRSSVILRALYERARWRRENDALYLQPGVMAQRLQMGLPMERITSLPAHKPQDLPKVSLHRGGTLGNQNARKYGRSMREIRKMSAKQ